MLDRLVEGEAVAQPEFLQEHGRGALPEGHRGWSPFAPDADAVIPHQVGQDDGEIGREGAAALPVGKDAILVLHQLEESPGAKLVRLVIGQAAAPAQPEKPLLDQVEVLLEKGPPRLGGLPGAGVAGPVAGAAIRGRRMAAGGAFQERELCGSRSDHLAPPERGPLDRSGGGPVRAKPRSPEIPPSFGKASEILRNLSGAA